MSAECFPPAAFIDEELAARGLPRAEFLDTLTLGQRRDVIDVLEGKPMTPRAAGALSRAFGTSVHLWLNLDAVWWEWLARELNRLARA